MADLEKTIEEIRPKNGTTKRPHSMVRATYKQSQTLEMGCIETNALRCLAARMGKIMTCYNLGIA